MSPWPALIEADCTGEGGGCESSSRKFAISGAVGEVGDASESARLVLDLVLRADFTDAASDLSRASPLDIIAELRGLSVFPPPGILDRRFLNERVESLVSDFPNEG